MGKLRYGVILDAGSSGTRLHIYRWLNAALARQEAREKDIHKLPELTTKKKWTMKIHPGISEFGQTPQDVGSDHLGPLFDHALSVIPEDEVENTPIFLLATAGMRLLPDRQRKALLEQICSYAQENTAFQLPDCDLHIQVIPGETEGLYGWIAANYLLGGFDSPVEHNHGKGHHTYGFLDMGGASAQIAFAPNETESRKHADDLKLLRLRNVYGEQQEYRVFVTTWLGFGVREARRRYIEALLEAADIGKIGEYPDPCLPSGLTVNKNGTVLDTGLAEMNTTESYLLGTGKFSECLAQTYPLLEKDVKCADPPCLVHGVHVPAIDFDVNHFVGVSEYWHTTHEVFEMGHTDKSYDFNTYQHRVKEFCDKTWDVIQEALKDKEWGKKVDEDTAAEVCFKASWIINMLHDGIGIPRVGLENTQNPQPGNNGTKEVIENAKEKGYLDPFQAVNKIDDTEVSWTLGRMVLYAASEVPPLDEATLDVGFGANEPGVPTDFQPAGGTVAELTDDLLDEISATPTELPAKPLPRPSTPTFKNTEPLIDTEIEPPADWADTVLSRPNLTRRGPGLLLIVFIFAVIFFLLCGRKRRAATKSGFPGNGGPGSTTRKARAPRKRLGLTGILSSLTRKRGDSGGKYAPLDEERLDAQGPHPDDFELGALDDDYSDTEDLPRADVRKSRQSTLGSPRITEPSSATASGGGQIDGGNGAVVGGVGLGLGPANAFERGGLTVRTDSRDRIDKMLSPSATRPGIRSRNTSPNRWKGPLVSLKES